MLHKFFLHCIDSNYLNKKKDRRDYENRSSNYRSSGGNYDHKKIRLDK